MALAGAVLTAFGLKHAVGASSELLESAADLLFDGAGKRVLDDVHARLRGYIGRVPGNHDLEHALRYAELTTGLVLLQTYRCEEELGSLDQRGAQPPPFIAAAQTWLHHQLGLAGDLRVKTNKALMAELEREVDRVLATQDRAALREALRDAATQVWAELKAGAEARGGGEPPPGDSPPANRHRRNARGRGGGGARPPATRSRHWASGRVGRRGWRRRWRRITRRWRRGRASGCRSTGRRRRTISVWHLRHWAGGTARLREAVAAFRAALEERTRERVPLDWARTQSNLGNALRALGERESGTARLAAALAAYDAALSVFVPAKADHYIQVCRSNRGRAISVLAERKAGGSGSDFHP